jgi:hypothetical protein
MSTDYGNRTYGESPVVAKRAREYKDFRLSWAVDLAGDSITGSVWRSEGMTVDTSWVVGSTAYVRLYGGYPGSVELATNTITTLEGSIFERSLAIKIEGRRAAVIAEVPEEEIFNLLSEDGLEILLQDGNELVTE